jgi:hypothetical protein
MITQRFTGDQGTMTAKLVIETNPEDAGSYAELLALQEELKLRPNVQTQGSIISTPPIEDVPPPIE